MSTEEDIRFAPYSNLVTSFKGNGHTRCLRISAEGSTNAIRRKLSGHSVPWPDHCVSLVPPDRWQWLQATVYLVSLSDNFSKRWYKQPKNFLAVALSDEALRSYLDKRYGGLSMRYAGMARYALDIAMKRTSTRNHFESGVTSKAKSTAEANINIVTDDGEEYSIRVEDNLLYAAAALSGGSGDVTIAMQKAANSIAGYLRKIGGDSLAHEIPTPYPELVKEKVA
jgi:hypothetical protein